MNMECTSRGAATRCSQNATSARRVLRCGTEASQRRASTIPPSPPPDKARDGFAQPRQEPDRNSDEVAVITQTAAATVMGT